MPQMQMPIETYQQIEKYILEIPKFTEKHTLEDTRRLFDRVVGSKLCSKMIHIAGTNGKGSVCAYLRSILIKSGCSVGVFTSPHLETMRERICLGEEMISEEDFVRMFQKVHRTWNSLTREKGDSERRRLHPSFFEMLFLMAMTYFEEKAPDYIILETGLGGRLDATNIIAAHDYYPYGYKAIGKGEVARVLDACIAPLEHLQEIILQNSALDDSSVREIYNSTEHIPTIRETVVAAMRRYLNEREK